MRRFYEYLLLAALIAVAVIAAVALTYEPPRERPPLRESAIWAPYEYLPDDSAATIDGARGCLVLEDGRNFICAGAASPSQPEHPPA